jgi:hypothetical protein
MLLVAIHGTIDPHTKIVLCRKAVNEFLNMYEEFIGHRLPREDSNVDELLSYLENKKLILFCYHNLARRKERRKRIKLTVPMNAVHTALKDHPQFGTMVDYIEESNK